MIYTKMTETAMKIAYAAHKDQMDKGGVPYVFHPYHLAEQMTTEETVTAALLHDVVEDTDVTIDDLRAAGITEPVLRAVSLLTHDKSEDYESYVKRIKTDPIARAVKIADLKHNGDPSRSCGDPHIEEKIRRYYLPALQYLTEE